MATASDLIRGSLQDIGVLAEGETPTAAMQADALVLLNGMMDAWSAENLHLFARVREEFSLTAGQQARTMGVGGHFNTSRPSFIDEIKIEDQSASGTPEYPVEILNTAQWAAIGYKAQTAAIPTKVYVEYGATTITLYFWGVPSATNKAVIYSQKPLSSFVAGTTFALPPGHYMAVRYSLAEILAPSYARVIRPEYAAMAANYRANIQRKNIETPILTTEFACQPFDINQGNF